MTKTLYLFVDSERPDAYLNSMVYSVLHLDIRRVVFLHIQGVGISEVPEEEPPRVRSGVSARVLGNVQSLLQRLAERAEYEYFTGKQAGTRVSLVNGYGQDEAKRIGDYYHRCYVPQVSYSSEELRYEDLRSRLREISAESPKCLVDVTAVKKRYLGDIVAAGLVEGVRGLYVFDILKKPDYDNPWRILLHELDDLEEPGFRYQNILDTRVFRSCARSVVIRAPRLRWAVGVTVVSILAVVILSWVRTQNTFLLQLLQSLSIVGSVSSALALFFLFVSPRKSV